MGSLKAIPSFWVVLLVGFTLGFFFGLFVGLATGAKIVDERTEVYQQWADESLVPTPRGRVRLVFGGCQTEYGVWTCSMPGVISLAPEHENSRPVFLHEIGHIFDYDSRGRWRYRFKRVTGIPDGQKWADGPNEVFASAYSLCARFISLPVEYETQYEYRPDAIIHMATCDLIRRVGKRR